MVNLEDWPECLHLPLTLMLVSLCLPHLSLKLLGINCESRASATDTGVNNEQM